MSLFYRSTRDDRRKVAITGNFKGSCGRRWFIRTGADSGIGIEL